MNKIKNIIFDLGGVIMNLDVPKTIIEFEKIGITNIVNNTGHHYTDPIFYDFEIGKVSEFEFIEKLKSISILDPSTNEVIEAWNAMILDMPSERIDILLNLKENYKIFLLSNTNSIHQKKFISEVNEENNISFNDLFQKAYYSFEVGIRKPDKEVFEFTLNESNLNPKETLFVDDSIDNIKAAQDIGIQTYHIDGKNSIEKLFSNN
jgi:HAD superfamily hydrolase (TIGR01509 family)